MRVSHAAYLVSASILVLATIVTLVLIWASGLLKKPYQVVDEYNTIRQAVTVDFRSDIQSYFESGDATKLHKAEKLIFGIQEKNLPKLPIEISELLYPSLKKISDAVKTKLRGSGKQGADPQMLLKNSERQMQGVIDSVADYSLEGRGLNPKVAYDYLLFSNELNQLLQSLISARQNLISLKDQNKKEMIEDYLDKMKSTLTKIKKLPKMGIYEKEEEDDFANLLGGNDSADDNNSQVDKIDTSISEISSLIKRYLNDIETTQKQIIKVENSRLMVKLLSEELELNIKKADQQILSWRDEIESKVFAVFIVIIGIMFFMAIAIFSFLSLGVLKPLNLISRKMEEISQGEANLNVRLHLRGKNELSEMSNAFNLFVSKVADLVSEVKNTTIDLHSNAQNANEMISDSKQMVIDQQERTTQIAAAMHEMSATIEEIRSNIMTSDAIVSETNQKAIGVEKFSQESSRIFDQLANEIDEASTVIQKLSDDSKKVETVMDVIRQIAEQTNLLALNAAIEAARAGDNGRGFAVVADEVRVLAQRTQNSIEEIRQIIDSLLKGANDGADVMQGSAVKMKNAVEKHSEISDIFCEITSSISNISQMSASVATATEEQSYGVAEIAQNVEGIKLLSDTISESVVSAAKASESINSLSTNLDELVRQFE